jgi:hypothetical protein
MTKTLIIKIVINHATNNAIDHHHSLSTIDPSRLDFFQLLATKSCCGLLNDPAFHAFSLFQ